MQVAVYMFVDSGDSILMLPPCQITDPKSGRLGFSPLKTGKRCIERKYSLRPQDVEFILPLSSPQPSSTQVERLVGVVRAAKLSPDHMDSAVPFSDASKYVADEMTLESLRAQLLPWVKTAGKDPVKCFQPAV